MSNPENYQIVISNLKFQLEVEQKISENSQTLINSLTKENITVRSHNDVLTKKMNEIYGQSQKKTEPNASAPAAPESNPVVENQSESKDNGVETDETVVEDAATVPV